MAEMDEDPVGIWKAENAARMAAKEAEAAAFKEQTLKDAEAARDKFAAERAQKIEATKDANREKEAAELATATEHHDNAWEGVAKLVDTSNKAEFPVRDAARFKSVLLKLKHTPIAQAV